jgi:hypothetical protein
MIAGAILYQYAGIEKQVMLDHNIWGLLGKSGGGEDFPAAKVAESCGSEAWRNLIKLKRLYLVDCTGVPIRSSF